MAMNTGVSFGLASDAYKSFRIEYPPALFTQIEHAGTSMRRNLAVDLGSGTGLSLPPLLQRFDRVIAVEPDARMAEKIAHHEKLEINVSRAEKFDIDSGRVDLITCATAFYWMDGPTVINHMIRWLHPDGLIAVYRYGFPKLPGTIANIVYRELEQHWNAFRSPRLIDEEYTWRCFTSSDKLKDLSRVNIPNVVTMDASALTGFFSSTSYCSAYMRSIENAESYLAAFRKELLEAAGNDQLRVDFEVELVTAHI